MTPGRARVVFTVLATALFGVGVVGFVVGVEVDLIVVGVVLVVFFTVVGVVVADVGGAAGVFTGPT